MCPSNDVPQSQVCALVLRLNVVAADTMGQVISCLVTPCQACVQLMKQDRPAHARMSATAHQMLYCVGLLQLQSLAACLPLQVLTPTEDADCAATR